MEISLLENAARAYRDGGDLNNASKIYKVLITFTKEIIDSMQASITDWSPDQFYCKWQQETQRIRWDETLENHYRFVLMDVQVLLENLSHTFDEDTSYKVFDSLHHLYIQFTHSKEIVANIPSSDLLGNLRRFTYGRYMILVNEPEIGFKELKLIKKSATPPAIYQAAKILLSGDSVSFIHTQAVKKTKIVTLFPHGTKNTIKQRE